MTYKLGSLFDGSGGFPLAGSLCGIEPVWASEVEPYPIAVTRSRFLNMKHLGDVSKVKGSEIEPVNIITFGSPCQDLSVAGKRAGLKHEANGDGETTRSGLFMEAVRIIKEMREATNGVYPNVAIFENVPGIFSSNRGEDFRTVLEEFIKIVEPGASMPPVPKGGWAYADSFRGDRWSLAYRTFDAQHWGVPQRRRRIHLVLHLTGECAGEILFKRESLRGHFAEGGTPWKRAAADVGGGAASDDSAGEIAIGFDAYNQALTGDKSKTLNSAASDTDHVPCVVAAARFKAGQGVKARSIGYEEERFPTLASEAGGNSVPSVCIYESHPMDSRIKEIEDDISPTVSMKWHKGAADTPLVVKAQVFDARGNGDICSTITGDHEGQVSDYTSVICMATQQGGAEIMADKCPTITASAGMSGNNQPVICMAHGQANAEITENISPTLNCNHKQPIVLDRAFYNQGQNAQYDPQYYTDGTVPTLVAKGPAAVAVRYIVRRLTPTECARLQGFPDSWGHPDRKDELTDEEYAFWLEARNTHAAINGKAVKDYTREQMLSWYNKLHTDSAEYKMWGNGIALPPALYVMQGIVDALDKEVAV